MICLPDSRSLDEAASRLRAGELVSFPTETVYGLGANAWNAQAVAKIFAAKGRPATNPLIVHVASVAQLELAVPESLPSHVTDGLQALNGFWPGSLTLVLPRNSRIPDIVTAGLDTVGVRIPAHPVALDLLRRCEFPVAAPSANPSNYVSPTCAEHVDRELGEKVAMILDGGRCQAGLESTIVTLVEQPPRLLRAGALPVEAIAEKLGLSVTTLLRHAPTKEAAAHDQSQLSPGRLPEHYAPRTRLLLASDVESQLRTDSATAVATPTKFGRILFRADSPLLIDATEIICLSEHGALDEIARGLFAALRQLDHRGLDAIVVDTCEETGLGRAIMDRLRRACRGSQRG